MPEKVLGGWKAVGSVLMLVETNADLSDILYGVEWDSVEGCELYWDCNPKDCC